MKREMVMFLVLLSRQITTFCLTGRLPAWHIWLQVWAQFLPGGLFFLCCNVTTSRYNVSASEIHNKLKNVPMVTTYFVPLVIGFDQEFMDEFFRELRTQLLYWYQVINGKITALPGFPFNNGRAQWLWICLPEIYQVDSFNIVLFTKFLKAIVILYHWQMRSWRHSSDTK